MIEEYNELNKNLEILGLNKIKEELNNIGITPSVVYPDFTGLAEEIKKPHKFISNNELILNESDHFLPIPLDN